MAVRKVSEPSGELGASVAIPSLARWLAVPRNVGHGHDQVVEATWLHPAAARVVHLLHADEGVAWQLEHREVADRCLGHLAHDLVAEP